VGVDENITPFFSSDLDGKLTLKWLMSMEEEELHVGLEGSQKAIH
jgi:hypothetical protein